MARDFQIAGERLVMVKGIGALADQEGDAFLSELGLTSEPIRVRLNIRHKDIHAADFGGEEGAPAEILWLTSDAHIQMTLVHYDRVVLEDCIAESCAGASFFPGGSNEAGTFAAAGTPMGGGVAPLTSGNHYISLNLVAPPAEVVAGIADDWHFPTCVLVNHVEIPLGTEKSMVKLTWRAVSYAFSTGVASTSPSGTSTVTEIQSSDTVLWDHFADS